MRRTHPNPHRHIANAKLANTMNGDSVRDVKARFGLTDELRPVIDGKLFIAIVSQTAYRSLIIVVTHPPFKRDERPCGFV